MFVVYHDHCALENLGDRKDIHADHLPFLIIILQLDINVIYPLVWLWH